MELEKIVDKTFEEGYCCKGTDIEKLEKLPQSFNDPEILEYLKSSKFDAEKSIRLFYACDSFFRTPRGDSKSKKSMTHNPSTLITKLFLERIRYPFVYGLSPQQEEEIEKKYKPEGWRERSLETPFKSLKKCLVWGLSVSEGMIAKNSILKLPKEVRINFSLSSLKHADEACEYGSLKLRDYYGRLATELFVLGKEISAFNDESSLSSSLSGELRDDFQKISESQEPYFKILRLLKNHSSLDELTEFCFREARENYCTFFTSFGSGRKEESYKINRGMLGITCLFLAQVLKTKEEKYLLLDEAKKNLEEAKELGYNNFEILNMLGQTYGEMANLVWDANEKKSLFLNQREYLQKAKKAKESSGDLSESLRDLERNLHNQHRATNISLLSLCDYQLIKLELRSGNSSYAKIKEYAIECVSASQEAIEICPSLEYPYVVLAKLSELLRIKEVREFIKNGKE